MKNLIKYIYYYIIISQSGLFDRNFYLSSYPDVRKADLDPLWHFIKYGWKEFRAPSPHFNTEFYLRQNADVLEQQINPLIHYIKFGALEGRNPKQNSSPAYNLLNFETEYYQFRKSWRRDNFLKFLNILSNSTTETKGITHIICLPFFSTGGAELVATNYAKAIISETKGTVLILTDENKKDIELNLEPRIIKYSLDDFVNQHEMKEKKILLFDIIISLRPKVVHNINSVVLWELFMEKGESLRKYSRLFASIFALQFDENGEKVGYAEYYLKSAIPYLSGLLTDNNQFISDAIREYHLESSLAKFKCVYNPSSPLNERTLYFAFKRLRSYKKDIQESHKINCIWAGRIDNEKRWDLFLEIVQKCEFADFSMYGQSVVDKNQNFPNYSNLYFKGIFHSTEEIFLKQKYDVFIFTSRWEGMPNILIEAGTWGIPIIAPNVGGISELINEKTGFLLSNSPTSNDYKDTLLYIRDNPGEAVVRSTKLLELITKRHTWQHFISDIKNINGYL